MSALAPLLTTLAVVAYLTAVLIAFPLGVPGLVDPNYALIPLGIGGLTMALALVAESQTR